MNNILKKMLDNPDSLSKQETEELLTVLREEMNELDKDISALIIKRIKVSLNIARAKNILGLPSYSPDREKNIMESVIKSAPDELSRKVLKNIYERIIDESRGLQKLSTKK